MKFALIVTQAPAASHAASSALQFAEAAVAAGHMVERVFFYFDAVTIASDLIVTPGDERDVGEAWARFGASHEVELAVCISASLRRGVIDEDGAARHQRTTGNLRAGFEVVGLGQLIAAMVDADRCVTF